MVTATALIRRAEASPDHRAHPIPVDVGRKAWHLTRPETRTHYVVFLRDGRLDAAYRADADGNLLVATGTVGTVARGLGLA